MKNIFIVAFLSLISFSSLAQSFILNNDKVELVINDRTAKGKVDGVKLKCTSHSGSADKKSVYLIFNCNDKNTLGLVIDRETVDTVVVLGKGGLDKKSRQYKVLFTDTTKID